MTAKNTSISPSATFDPLIFEREASAAMAANNVTTDAQWQSLVDPLVDGIVNGWSGTAGQKTFWKALIKALAHSLKVNSAR